jgi:ubiquinone/menaquinone biosynthesis C-methylase UbiE
MTLDRKNPYHPDNEPPEEILLVNLFMQLTKLINQKNFVTPHLFGGSDLSKVEYEYNSAVPSFLEKIEDYISLDIFDNKDVLDVGCGWGGKMVFYAEHTSLKTITGFDMPGYLPAVSNEFALRKKVDNCFFHNGNAEAMPYEDNQFDLVIMEDVLEHVFDPEKVMSECYRVLKKQGTIIVKFPSFKSMFAHHLDRAISLPALHYILPIQKWCAGLNYLLLDSNNGFNYQPFKKSIKTKYCEAITVELNGLDFKSFCEIVTSLDFETQVLELVPGNANKGKRKIIKPFYNFAFSLEFLKEFLSSFVLFIGKKR